jgi:hypothetical protein
MQASANINVAVLVCRKQQQQQARPRPKQTTLLGGVAGGSGSTNSAFLKKWPNMSREDIQKCVDAIALAFYACNLPHSLIEQPDFAAMILTLAPWIEGQLPSRKQLSTTLLDRQYAQTSTAVETWVQQQVGVSWDGQPQRHTRRTAQKGRAAAAARRCVPPAHMP